MDRADEYGVPADPMEGAKELADAAAPLMGIRSYRWVEPEEMRRMGVATGTPALELRGRLLIDSQQAYKILSEKYRSMGYVAFLREDGQDHLVLAVRGVLPRRAGRDRVAVVLFFLTLLSVLWIGSLYESGGQEVSILAGWPFALSLLGILMAHEMGHFLVAKWQKVPASLPYFIPMPLSLLGTMGAVIQTTAPPRNRKALLLLGAAGPLAGMVVAIPVLIIGLSSSSVHPVPLDGSSFQEGNSLLYAWLKYLIFGRFLPSNGEDVFINSVALAGWAGLLVTALNLIPAGQLDGGHIAYAVLGRKARWLTWLVIGALLALSPLWEGWLLWAGLVFFLGRIHSVPLDDVTPLGPKERAIALVTLALFVLVFIPIPMAIH
ncbi:MAG: site-2 protease family protein [Chloroflexota bacterium]|jgi:hypothetical protein